MRVVRILVIGGSSFVGRHFVQAAIDGGHDVTLFNRGRTDPDAFPRATHLTGDRDRDLTALGQGEWDATVDVCAYLPRQVRTLVDALGERGGHYTLVSTISVYDHTKLSPGYTEDAPVHQPAWDDELTMERYGPLKVACEQVARDVAGDRLLVVRPGYVIGPHDPTGRFPHWVEQVAGGEPPLVGPDADQPLQAIDGRDLAAFTLAQVERGAVTTVHVTAPEPAPTFAEVLEGIADGLGKPLPEVRWTQAGDGLPLSSPPEVWPMMQAGLGHARAAGLHWRPLPDTARDTAAWLGLTGG